MFKGVVLGLVIGIASIMPGLSGGALAAALGLYEPMIRAVSRFFEHPKKHLLFLTPIGLGATVGIIGFSNVMEWLMQQAPDQVKWLFLGLVTGSLPSLLRTANAQGFRRWWLLLALFTTTTVPLLTSAPRIGVGLAIANKSGWFAYLFYGLIIAVGTIVPGISSSFVLISMGAYDQLLRAMASVNLLELLPVAIGFGLGVLSLARLVEWLFRRWHGAAYYAVLGFLLGSALLTLPELTLGWTLALDAALFIAGIGLSWLLLRIEAVRP